MAGLRLRLARLVSQGRLRLRLAGRLLAERVLGAVQAGAGLRKRFDRIIGTLHRLCIK